MHRAAYDGRLQRTHRLALVATQEPLHAQDRLHHTALNVRPQFGTNANGAHFEFGKMCRMRDIRLCDMRCTSLRSGIL
jgi:hypothetical protein